MDRMWWRGMCRSDDSVIVSLDLIFETQKSFIRFTRLIILRAISSEHHLWDVIFYMEPAFLRLSLTVISCFVEQTIFNRASTKLWALAAFRHFYFYMY